MDVSKFRVLLFMIMATTILTGCTMGLSVATTGAQAVYNRNHLRQQVSDNYITMQAYRKIYNDTDEFKHANISIATFDNNVLLTGQTTEPSQPAAAERIVKSITDVNHVYNHITLEAPSSALTSASDGWITAKIRSKLLAEDNVNPDHIKVVTENGTVYLMGIVFPEESEAVVDVARHTEGVQAVVKHFYYLRVSKN
ncbi:MAG: BON domain-containing protein [Gammaproteobacteria bacterium]